MNRRSQPGTQLTLVVAAVLAVITFTASAALTGRATLAHAASTEPLTHAHAQPRPVAHAAAPATPAPTAAVASVDSPPIDGMQAAAAVLIDLDRHQVLWSHAADASRAPASLAKIVTVLVAVDKAPLERVVTVPDAAVDTNPDHTTMGLGAGQQVTIRELLYGVFLVSGNDAAETLAQTLEPRAQFIADMNAKAAALGMRSTDFVNPTGLDAPGETSTALDLALATGYLAEHDPGLLAIAQQPEVWLYANAGHPLFDLVNLNKLILWPYDGATGLKTGYTGAAGGCVAATAERSGRHLVAVVLGSDVMFSDAARLFDYGWAQ